MGYKSSGRNQASYPTHYFASFGGLNPGRSQSKGAVGSVCDSGELKASEVLLHSGVLTILSSVK